SRRLPYTPLFRSPARARQVVDRSWGTHTWGCTQLRRRALLLARHRLGPLVVGLPGRRALHRRDDDEVAGDLVAGERPSREGLNVLQGRGTALLGRDDSRDPLAVPLVRHAHDQHVGDVGVAVEDVLHLLDIDLLAPAVDALRAAPEEHDRPVV